MVLVKGRVAPLVEMVPVSDSAPCAGIVNPLGLGAAQANPLSPGPESTRIVSLWLLSMFPAMSLAPKVSVVTPVAIMLS